MKLHGAHVLVTGASRGIGRAVVHRAAAAGARLTLVGRSATALQALAGQVGGRALVVDLSQPAERVELIQRAEDMAGPLDVLLNVAGVDAVGSVLDISGDELSELFQVNLLAPAELCRQALPGMVARRRGHLVNVSSGFSTVLAPGMTGYCASKAGLSHLTAALRAELVGTSVGTTLVELGPVNTGMYGDIQRDGIAGPALARAVRFGAVVAVEPDDVARQICLGIESASAHVVLPRRMAALLALTWFPRRASQVVLGGLPRR